MGIGDVIGGFSMKIMAFEVRADEEEYLDALVKEHGIEIVRSSAVPGPENADLTEGCEGVSLLGQGQIDRALLEQYHKNQA